MIKCGNLIPDDLIPSEPQIAATLDVSQGTVKKAMENLFSQKRLYRHRDKGACFFRIDFNNGLFRFFSYRDEKGQQVRVHEETTISKFKTGTAKVCKRLEVPTGTESLQFERVA